MSMAVRGMMGVLLIGLVDRIGLLKVCDARADVPSEVMTVTTLYTQPINPANGVHPLWTPVQHYRGMTFVVCPDVKLRPLVTQIDRAGRVTTVFLDTCPDPVYYASSDGHNRFTLGIDKNGYIHIMGDMHGYAPWAGMYTARYQYQSIMYWKSNKALDVTGGFTFCGGLNDATRLPGVEYGGDSRFFNDRNGELYYSARVRAFEGSTLGGSEPFIAYGMYRYNTSNGVWTALGGKVDPADAPGARNFNTVLYWEYTLGFEAYQTQPRFDNNNRLYFSIAGNTAGTQGSGLIFAYSDDCGLTWKKANGTAIPGLPLRGKDGVVNQGDLIDRSTTVAQQSSVFTDKNGKMNVAGRTWTGSAWVKASGGYGILGPDDRLTAEGGSVISRTTAIGEPFVNHQTGFGQIFSISELALQNENAVYAIGLPPGFNFVGATNMAVFKATFRPSETGAVAEVPKTPKMFKPVPDNGQVWLSWTASAFATRYTIKRATASRGPYTTLADNVTDNHEYVDTMLVNGTTYYYVVSAAGPLGASPFSTPVSVTPADQPVGPIIKRAVGGNGNVELSWVPLWPSAIRYTVKRAATQAGPYRTIAKDVSALQYTDTGLKNGEDYYYVVSASGPGGIASPDSSPIKGTPFRYRKILKYWSIGYDPSVQGVASASSENPPRERAAQAFDGTGAKWLAMASTCWLQYRFAEGVKWAVTRYTLTSGGDGPERDPKDWTFQGSNDGKAWTTLDTQAGQTFPERNMVKTYDIDNPVKYQYYRLNITANAGNGITQLAEVVLWADGPVLPAVSW